MPPLSAAIALDCAPAIIGLLLDRGADPSPPGPDGRTPYQLAVRKGQAELAGLLAEHGARTDLTSTDRFLSACRQGSRAEAALVRDSGPGRVELSPAGCGYLPARSVIMCLRPVCGASHSSPAYSGVGSLAEQ